MTTTLASLLVQETKDTIYSYALNIARNVGLPVTTWQPGDPTRSLYHLEAELLSSLEALVTGYIRAGFLDFAAELAKEAPEEPAARMWLKILAEQVYGVTVQGATYATTDVTLTNNGGGYYPDIEPGTLTFKSTTSEKTYHNTTGGTLNSGVGQTLTVTVVADEAGSDSSAGAGEIDDMVTTLLGVTCSNDEAAIANDEDEPDTIVQQCRDKLDAFSPNGPKGAYSYVARNSELTGTTAVTRVRVYSDSDTGDVTVYLAGPSGGVAEADRALVEDAILDWATPLCITPIVLAATSVPVAVTYQLWIYKSCNKTAAEVEEEIESALEALFSTRDIGGDIIPPATTGSLYHSMIESTIRSVFAQTFRVVLSAPSGDTALGNGEVPTLGAVTATINLVVDP
jgi:hypothetical protein